MLTPEGKLSLISNATSLFTIFSHDLCNNPHLLEVSFLHTNQHSGSSIRDYACASQSSKGKLAGEHVRLGFFFPEASVSYRFEQGVRSDFCMGLGNGLANGQGKHPLFSFGVISDVQYADIPDGHSFLGVPRYYRHSILVLQRAVKNWNDHKNLNFAINFGDIVDGKCPKDQSLNAVKKVASEFENFHSPVYHMTGNHCLYNLPRDKLLPLLKIPNHGDGRTHAYYDFSPTPGYRFVVLDGHDISAIGWPHDHPNRLEALKILSEKTRIQIKTLRGVNRRVLNVALECPAGTNAFGYIDVYDNMLSLVGTDRVKSTDFCFDF
ncbi:hypothetical protein CXB51_032755 [Gossypium anomalum]|uniref:Calcineurin-like phosphoesterase domain-containing protein n=1 Tax=Gossypium anomalum TaxID=47600 RepID=A0A8J6CQ40_9ROSI|nr:hypothetical protein CXB51_032755 [Gossypium anomalum]